MIEPNPSLASLSEAATATLSERAGRVELWQAVAPGRVNLIGEHTDYNDGWVLPMAIDRYTAVAAAPGRDPGSITVRSLALEEEGSLSLNALDTPHPTLWMRYVQGVIQQYAERGLLCPALDMVIASSVPLGGGLSSSAALELAVAHLLEQVTERPLSSAERIQASLKAEREMAGVPCGIMDQTVVERARRGHALLLDCRDQAVRSIPFSPEAVALLVIHSGVSHALAEGAYAQRRSDCERACELLGVNALRDVNADSLDRLGEHPLLCRRARHVVTENARVIQAATAMEASDWVHLGALMTESHRSLRDDYEVSCPELDTLVDFALAERGVYGARLTGGGFGGCVIALVDEASFEAIADGIAQRYAEHIGFSPVCYRVAAEAGASDIEIAR